MVRLGFYVHAYVLDKEEGNNTMYNIQNVARLLGVSEPTARRWIAESNIEKTVIETDRKRIYITYNDILALADKYKPLKVNIADQEKFSQERAGLYSIDDVARILGVAEQTVRKWMASANIEKKLMANDRKRVYVSYSDIVTLAEKHNRTITYDNVMKEQDSNTQEDDHPQEKKLYTVTDAALFLGAAESTVRRWLPLYNIEKRTVETDRGRIYITYNDIMMLASKRKHESGYPVDIATNIREIRSRLEKIEDGILNLEKYIKRSIYLGK
jgi:predicted site-specific integrase-resolvase